MIYRDPVIRVVRLFVCIVLFSSPSVFSFAQEATSTTVISCLDSGGDLQFDPRGWDTDFCKHSVPYSEILSGGPPRDGIPPIDSPAFVSVDSADTWIEENEPVLALQLGGQIRVYPLQILIWHEIVNDQIGDLPIAVTFCPLCYSAIVFERPIVNGESLTFGTSGNLRYSDMIMWDRQTQSWWQQFTGKAIVGELTGFSLEPIPVSILAWQSVRENFPDSQVLSKETGFTRPYGDNPYVGYDDISQRPYLFQGPENDKLPPMARVVGLKIGDFARAYPLEQLRSVGTINDIVDEQPLVIMWQAGTASAVNQQTIASGRDIGTARVFERTVSGRTLSFHSRSDGLFEDRETGSTWTILGEAISGPLIGKKLAPLVHLDVFWFAWSVFQPGGDLFGNE